MTGGSLPLGMGFIAQKDETQRREGAKRLSASHPLRLCAFAVNLPGNRRFPLDMGFIARIPAPPSAGLVQRPTDFPLDMG
jgi:hypothetical protein